MVETRRLKNVVIVMQTILSLVLSRKIFGNVSTIEGARTIFDLPIILELFPLQFILVLCIKKSRLFENFFYFSQYFPPNLVWLFSNIINILK